MMGELIRSKKAANPCYNLNYVLIGFSPYLKVSLNLSKQSLERKNGISVLFITLEMRDIVYLKLKFMPRLQRTIVNISQLIRAFQ